MTSHPLYHTKPQYLWYHIHFRNDITPPVLDIAPTVSFSSQHLHWYHTQFWMTSHPPSVWHHIHYIDHHIQSLCHLTTVLMTSQPLYMKPHPVCRATYKLYMRYHSHYLCPHTHCIDNITPTLCMTSNSPYVWHRCTIQDITSSCYELRPRFLCHHTHYIEHRFHCICVIISTVFMLSHQLYFWDHIHYNSWHRIHCIQHDSHWICVITLTPLMISHPFYVWH